MAGHENRKTNQAAWAAMRAAETQEAERRREQLRAEKEARRAANRAAWWAAIGREVPVLEQCRTDW